MRPSEGGMSRAKPGTELPHAPAKYPLPPLLAGVRPEGVGLDPFHDGFTRNSSSNLPFRNTDGLSTPSARPLSQEWPTPAGGRYSPH